MLYEYLLFLLSDDKVALLIQKGTPEIIYAITQQLLLSISYLPAYYALPVLNKWLPATISHTDSYQNIAMQIIKIKREEKLQKAYPWLIVLITLSVLIAMYYFSKK